MIQHIDPHMVDKLLESEAKVFSLASSQGEGYTAALQAHKNLIKEYRAYITKLTKNSIDSVVKYNLSQLTK